MVHYALPPITKKASITELSRIPWCWCTVHGARCTAHGALASGVWRLAYSLLSALSSQRIFCFCSLHRQLLRQPSALCSTLHSALCTLHSALLCTAVLCTAHCCTPHSPISTTVYCRSALHSPLSTTQHCSAATLHSISIPFEQKQKGPDYQLLWGCFRSSFASSSSSTPAGCLLQLSTNTLHTWPG
jgi:hypothetical protein